MALSLDDIRTFIRSHLDLDTDDLPDALVDVFIREGSKRVEKAHTRWPFYEATWPLTTVAGTASYAYASIDSTLDQIAAVSGADFELQWIGYDLYTANTQVLSNASGKPRFYSTWGSKLYLAPKPDAAYALTVRGYRKASDWMAGGAGALPDLPDELHNTVALWALAKAYAQQEDPEMASYYERQYIDELNGFMRRIVETPHAQPLVMGGTSSRPKGVMWSRLRYPWE